MSQNNTQYILEDWNHIKHRFWPQKQENKIQLQEKNKSAKYTNMWKLNKKTKSDTQINGAEKGDQK